jgi:hypothetical protein
MRRARAALLACAGVALLGGAACGGADSPFVVGNKLTIGTWGGDNAGMIATDSVTHVHIGCTLGDVPGTIALDADGRFAVNGSYVLRAYPVYVGPRLPAQFSGQVVGNRLTFAIAVNDTFGREPSMGPCPICRVPKRYAGTVASVPSGAPSGSFVVPRLN